jgi:hypothetical protein
MQDLSHWRRFLVMQTSFEMCSVVKSFSYKYFPILIWFQLFACTGCLISWHFYFFIIRSDSYDIRFSIDVSKCILLVIFILTHILDLYFSFGFQNRLSCNRKTIKPRWIKITKESSKHRRSLWPWKIFTMVRVLVSWF